jgi:hypothetical protein
VISQTEPKFSFENNFKPKFMTPIYKQTLLDSPQEKNQQTSKIRKFNINSPVFIKKGFNIDLIQEKSSSNIS